MAKVPQPQLSVIYEGKDITEDLTPTLLDISYTDKAEDESDEVTIRVEDVARLWQTSWKPAKGDKIEISFGYADKLIGSGTFEVDELDLTGPPDIVVIKAIASGVSSDLRTRKSRSFESTTLTAIVQEIADAHGLEILGTIPAVSINRATQNRETDLGFLHRIGKKYGVLFSPRGSTLVFTTRKGIDGATFVLTLDRTDLSSYQITQKTFGTYSKASVKYSDPDTAEAVTAESEYDGDEVVNSDTLEIFERAEDEDQAQEIADAALHEHNTKACTGTINLEGTPLLLSGNNIELTGFGDFTGVFQVTESTHTFVKSGGYRTNGKIKRVEKIDDPQKQAPKVALETLDLSKIETG